MYFLNYKTLIHNAGEVSQICKRERLQYVCVQHDDAHAQSICEILESFPSDDEQDSSDKQARNLENTEELLAEMSELEKMTVDGEGVCQSDNNKKSKLSKTLGSGRKTRSQLRIGNHWVLSD